MKAEVWTAASLKPLSGVQHFQQCCRINCGYTQLRAYPGCVLLALVWPQRLMSCGVTSNTGREGTSEMRRNETLLGLFRENTRLSGAASSVSFLLLFRILSPNYPLKNAHTRHTSLSAHTHSLAAHIPRHSRRQTLCRQKTIQDLLKVVVTGERYWGLGDAVVLFWCVRDARSFISGDVIPSSCSAPMLLTLHLRFDVLASVSL